MNTTEVIRQPTRAMVRRLRPLKVAVRFSNKAMHISVSFRAAALDVSKINWFGGLGRLTLLRDFEPQFETLV